MSLRPWNEFITAEGFAAPEHPGERLTSNLNYYSINYVLVMVLFCALAAGVATSFAWLGLVICFAHMLLRTRNAEQVATSTFDRFKSGVKSKLRKAQ